MGQRTRSKLVQSHFMQKEQLDNIEIVLVSSVGKTLRYTMFPPGLISNTIFEFVQEFSIDKSCVSTCGG